MNRVQMVLAVLIVALILSAFFVSLVNKWGEKYDRKISGNKHSNISHDRSCEKDF